MRKWSYEKRLKKASSTKTSPDDLRKLTKDESAAVRAAAGGNPNTPEDALRELADWEYWLSVMKAVASNPSTPKDVAEKLNKKLQNSVDRCN